jgi:hypothetical protein
MAMCGNCGKSFSPNRGDARFCSNRCRLVTFREGVELATIVKRHLSFGTRPTASSRPSRPSVACWRAGTPASTRTAGCPTS